MKKAEDVCVGGGLRWKRLGRTNNRRQGSDTLPTLVAGSRVPWLFELQVT